MTERSTRYITIIPSQPHLRISADVAALRDVQTVQELPNILVPHSARLLDVGGGLRDVLEGVARQLQLVLCRLGGLDIDAWVHRHVADDLLA